MLLFGIKAGQQQTVTNLFFVDILPIGLIVVSLTIKESTMTTANCQQVHEDEEPIPRLIYYTAQDLKNLAEKILKPYELTIEQFQPLKSLAFTPGLSQRQIGDACNKSAANLTRILDRLQKKNLIERRANPADRRTSLVFLTSQGESLVNEASSTSM